MIKMTVVLMTYSHKDENKRHIPAVLNYYRECMYIQRHICVYVAVKACIYRQDSNNLRILIISFSLKANVEKKKKTFNKIENVSKAIYTIESHLMVYSNSIKNNYVNGYNDEFVDSIWLYPVEINITIVIRIR